MKPENNIKLAGINFDKKELEKEFTKENIFIFKYKSIYQIHYSQAQKNYTSSKIMIESPEGVGYTKRGYYILANATFANKLIGYNFFKA